MIRSVLDTNALASGVLGFEREQSTPGAILRRWFARGFELVVSDHILFELKRTLDGPSFNQRVEPRIRTVTEAAFANRATRTEVTVTVSGVATHPEDDLVLAAAVSAGVEHLVTGDRQLLALGQYEDVKIVSPRWFLDMLTRLEDEEAELT